MQRKFITQPFIFLPTLFAVSLTLPFIVNTLATAADRGIADFPKLSPTNDWPWWRGPTRNGLAEKSQNVPTKWSETENVIWRASVPGRGHSSPTVVGKRVFLATSNPQDQSQSVLAFERETGKLVWTKELNRGGFPAKIHDKNTHSTPTIASDGQHLFVSFFHHEGIHATALNLDGTPVWQQKVGPFNPKKYEFGYAPSPLLYRNTVIICGEYDGDSSLKALDQSTGKEIWKTTRTSSISFSSPVVAHVAEKDQLLLSGFEEIASYDPATGAKLWTAKGGPMATCGTLVWDGDIVFASGGFPQAETLAVLADGSGKVLWKNQQKCYEQSMITVDGHLYALTDNGVMYCWRNTDGKEMWKNRLQGPVSSSPVFANGYIYWANELGTTYVFKPNPQRWDPVAENRLGEEGFASPAVCGNRMFIRTSDAGDTPHDSLFCLGLK